MGLNLSNIGKKIQGLEAQVNPFDNGATFNSVVTNRPPPPNLHPNFVQRNVINPIASADSFIAHNTGLSQLGSIANPFNSQAQKNQAGKDLITGLVKFPINAGSQLGNTINRAIGAPEQSKVVGLKAAPSLQTQYQQVKKSNGTLPAILQTGFSGISDVAPLVGGIKPTVTLAKAANAIPKNEAGFIQAGRSRQVVTHSPVESPELAPSVAAGKLSPKTEIVPINKIKMGSDVAGKYDLNTIKNYRQAIKNDQTIDPLVVSSKNGQIFLQDGKHRLAAMRQEGITDVPIVRQTTNLKGAALQSKLGSVKSAMNNRGQGGFIQIPGRGPKAVEAPSNPLSNVYYRGVNSEGMASNGYAQLGNGKYLSSDRKVAEFYAKNGGKVIQHKLSPDTKLLERDSPEGRKLYEKSFNEWMDKNGKPNRPDLADLQRKNTLAAGYDGINGTISGEEQNAKKYNQVVIFNEDKILGGKGQTPESVPLKPIVSQKNLGSSVKNTPKVGMTVKGFDSIPGVTEGLPPVKVNPTVKLASRTPPEIPTNVNPIKASLSNPAAGDYKAAITDLQQVNSSVDNAASIASNAVKKLSPSDKKLFVHARENPELIKNAENPKAMQKAVERFGRLTDTAHAYDIAAGGKTAHVANYYRHVVDLTKPEDAARFNQLAQQKGFTKDPFSYSGLNNQPRVFKSVKEAEGAGFKVTNQDPLQEIKDFANRAKGIVGSQALARGAQLADAARGPEAALTKKFELSPGNYVDVSPEANKALKGVSSYTPSTNKAIKGVRTVNAGLKSSILSLGQFHTINIGALRAAPTLIANGHPIAASKGLYGMFRGAFGTEYADRVIGRALDDGTVAKAAKIGMPYGGSGYDTTGTFLKHGVGSRTVFGKQIPMMHDQVVRSIIKDLERRKVPLDSPQAREAGLAGSNLMGELNGELQNISPKARKAMSDIMLAGQYTPSKFLQIKRAFTPSAYTKGGVAGQYAATNVLANVAATTAVIAGLGYLAKQKSDDTKDMLLRALIDPAVPTPFKDSKGNTIKLKTPGTDTSDIAKLLGIKLVRNSDGHLGASWNGLSAQTAEDFGRSRLSPLLASGLKVLTNTNYAGNPLYNPNADTKTKAEQAATTLTVGNLPIGAQGLAYTNAVKSRLPQGAQQALNAGSPGTNPVVKSIGSSFGLTPSSDQTVGKGKETAQFFSDKAKFEGSLNPAEQNIFNKITQANKDSFGNQIKNTAPLNKTSDYATLVANPDFTAKYQAYQQSQKSHDPLWDLSPANLRSYMQAQIISKNDPGGDSTTVNALYKNLPQDFFSKRNAYFDKLQASGVKFPASSTPQKPQMPQALVDFANNYHNLPYGTGARTKALQSSTGQAYIDYLNQNRLYNNQQRADLGLPPLADPSAQYSSYNSNKTSYTSHAKLRTPRNYNKKTKMAVKGAKVTYKGKKGKVDKGRNSEVAKAKVTLKKSLV